MLANSTTIFSWIHTAMKHSGEAHIVPLMYSATVRGVEVEAILNPAGITENDEHIRRFVTRCVHRTLQLSCSQIRLAPVTPNSDATALVQRSKTLSARCGIGAEYAKNTKFTSYSMYTTSSQRPSSVHTTFPQRIYSVHDVFTARKTVASA